MLVSCTRPLLQFEQKNNVLKIDEANFTQKCSCVCFQFVFFLTLFSILITHLEFNQKREKNTIEACKFYMQHPAPKIKIKFMVEFNCDNFILCKFTKKYYWFQFCHCDRIIICSNVSLNCIVWSHFLNSIRIVFLHSKIETMVSYSNLIKAKQKQK